MEVANLGRQPLDRGSNDAEGCEEHRMAVAWDDLCRHRLDAEAQLGGDMLLDLGRDLRERSYRARDGAGSDATARGDQPLPVARELGIGLGELEPECGRLGVDAMAAADGWGQLVLKCAALQHR